MSTLPKASIVAMLLAVAGCAQAPSDPVARAAYEQADDPAEPANRAIFAANQAVDRNLMKPVATAYKDYVPDGARRGIHNFSSNLGEPSVLVNDVLQGNVVRAGTTTARFVINSTVGVAGFLDVASMVGLDHHQADLGQTFGVWGIDPGPAVQMPLFGPSNLRDATGTVLGFVVDPLGQISGGAISVIRTVGGAGGLIGGRAELLATTNDLEKNSLDYYATLRSLSAQRRADLVREGKSGGAPPEAEEAPPPAIDDFSAATALKSEQGS